VIDVSRWQQAELGVTNSFGKYLLIRESTSPALANRSELIVLHELCHVFGAFHVDDPRSVMQPAIENCPHQFTVTQPTCDVMRLTRQMDLDRGVESLDAETIGKITDLYRKHRHPAETGEDPVTTGYAFQALLALQKEDWRRAWAMAYEVAQRSPKNLVAHLVIGQSALKLNDPVEAANRFREVIRQKRSQAVGHHGLAMALLLAGDAKGALQSAERALRLSPTDQEARELRDACRQLLEKQQQLNQLQKQIEKVKP
jgi:predicted Zn-dependent protease